jgi:hypothetical protein
VLLIPDASVVATEVELNFLVIVWVTLLCVVNSYWEIASKFERLVL